MAKIERQEDGRPVFCPNANYMAGKSLSMYSKCPGCEFEKNEVLVSESGRQWVVWYCTFDPKES